MTSTASITINTNLSSLNCQKYLTRATRGMNTAMERLSTGFRINSAADDAAGYAVSAGMEAKISGYDIIEMNSQMGLDMLTTQEGVLDIIGSYLQRIRDLTMQAANGTYGSASLNALNLEVTQRMDEINRLCNITDFNDTYLLDGSRQSDINLQVGLYSNARCVIKMDAFLFDSAMSTVIFGFRSTKDTTAANRPGYLDLTSSTDNTKYPYRARKLYPDGTPQVKDPNDPNGYLDGSYKTALAAALAENGIIKAEKADGDATILVSQDQKTISITNMCNAIYRNDSSARDFIDQIDKAIDNISLRCTKIGAYMNRLQSAIDATDIQRSNLTEANSTIKDEDVAKSSSDYIKYQILQQSAATLLSTANQMPSIALNLI